MVKNELCFSHARFEVTSRRMVRGVEVWQARSFEISSLPTKCSVISRDLHEFLPHFEFRRHLLLAREGLQSEGLWEGLRVCVSNWSRVGFSGR
jgi:hypothetical protein